MVGSVPPLPRDRSLDSTLALLRDPYRFISKRRRRYGPTIFDGPRHWRSGLAPHARRAVIVRAVNAILHGVIALALARYGWREAAE